jgi:MurNAc alpha-1-phosphate uridylyltransferase
MTPKALILAAGRGERMRPLTDATPKPLLAVQGKPLMAWHMEALARGGVQQVVVNTAWLGTQISSLFGPQHNVDKCHQLSISYSDEQQDFGGALETAGGIARALPQLGEIFWVVAGDVYAPDFVFDPAAVERFKASGKLAHLWLVPNPAHNLKGDFTIDAQGIAGHLPSDAKRYTYSTIGLYHRDLFAAPWCNIAPGNPQGVKAPLAPMLRAAMDNQKITAEVFHGAWTDVGTPERLAQLNNVTTDLKTP